MPLAGQERCRALPSWRIRAQGGFPYDYDYSQALKSANIVWNAETLDKWLTDPQAVAPGARMFFHLDNPQDRADVIAYLRERAK